MIISSAFSFLAFLALTAYAEQPGAAPPYEAPLRDLPWAQLNFLHTTDVHGWLSGHLQEPSFSADWGDYISFASHLHARADSSGSDLLLIDTGDRIEGNGLFDGSDPKGKYYYDLYKEQHIDVICTGNHELYKVNSSNAEWRQTVPNFKDSYVASNLDIIDPDRGTVTPLAQRFRKFETKNQKLRVLAFGFLFDFTGNANNTIVHPVEDTIKEEWFQKALEDREVDLILVIGHVGVRMNEFKIIFKAIRDVQWDTPVVFFGGHVHVRDYASYGKKSAAIASGRYLETIGFLSVDGIKGKNDKTAKASGIKFSRRYIDNNLFSLRHHSDKNATTFPTDEGKAVSKSIVKARKKLKLDKKHGCAPSPLYVNRAPYPSDESIFSWLADKVLPQQLAKSPRIAKEGKKALAMTNTGAMRFDIFKGPFTKDSEFLVSPFTSGFRFLPDVPAKIALRVLELLNGGGPVLDLQNATLKEWMMVPPEQMLGGLSSQQERKRPGVKLGSFINQAPLMSSNAVAKAKEDLKPGYTTIDDMGEDGDDTEHAKIDFYNVPNCIQAPIGFALSDELPEDEVVDLVFNEFIQPFILLTLDYLGLKKVDADTQVYLGGKTVTNVITDWVEQNWKC